MKARKYTSVVDHMSSGTGVSIPFARRRRCQRHGVEVADEGGRIPGHALHGRPGLLLQLLWWRRSSVAEPWRRPKGVRLLHVLLLGGEGGRRRTERRPKGVRWTWPELSVARPRIIVLRLVLRAGAGVAGRLLAVVGSADLPLVGSAALAGLAITSGPALAVPGLMALAVSTVGASGRRAWSGDEGG